MAHTNILMTGGTGFLGSALLTKLVTHDETNITVLKRSRSRMDRIRQVLEAPNISICNIDTTNLDELFSSCAFDIIIHCATNYGRGNTNILDIVDANLILPLKLLQQGIHHKIKAFINTDTIIDKRINYYSLSKKQFLDWLEATSGQIQCVNLALEHFYGPFDDESKFTTMIFHKLLRHEPTIPLTPGQQKRHFIYIDDVVSAFECVLANLGKFSNGLTKLEVSSECSISIHDFVTTAKGIIGNTTTRLDFGAVPYRPNELMDSQTDISKLLSLGWRPTISLCEGIRRTLEKEIKNEVSH